LSGKLVELTVCRNDDIAQIVKEVNSSVPEFGSDLIVCLLYGEGAPFQPQTVVLWVILGHNLPQFPGSSPPLTTMVQLNREADSLKRVELFVMIILVALSVIHHSSVLLFMSCCHSVLLVLVCLNVMAS
jgi:hypothetical protein